MIVESGNSTIRIISDCDRKDMIGVTDESLDVYNESASRITIGTAFQFNDLGFLRSQFPSPLPQAIQLSDSTEVEIL
jgi:hypothetical protein